MVPEGADDSPGQNRGRRVSELEPRSVSRWAAVGQTFAIGPIFSAGFLSGTVAVFAGFNTPLSVLLAGVGTLALAYVLGVYGRRYAGAGAVYEYLARGAHPSVGIAAAGTYVIGLLFLVPRIRPRPARRGHCRLRLAPEYGGRGRGGPG